jgi:putative peptidoglycan lipid II flippase
MSSLFRSTAVVSAMTFLSRILGLVRDIVVARFFGAGMATDAFFVAFKIPNFLRRLFAEGAFSQAFVPVLSEYQSQKGGASTQALVDQTARRLALTLFVVTLIGVLAAPILIYLFAPGFTDLSRRAMAIDMLRITFPYLFLISLTAFFGAILNAHHRFAIPAFTPVLLNLSLIGAAIWLSPHLQIPIYALAWGVFIGGVAQLLLQAAALRRLGMLPRLRRRTSSEALAGDEGVRRILRLMLPALFGTSVSQINLLLDTLLASLLMAGSVSWLYYADRLMEFPLGVYGIALATVILPGLSRKHAEANAEQFSVTLDWALRMVVLIAVPASVGLGVLAGPLLSTLFERGEFAHRDVIMAQAALWAYAMGLVAFVLVKVLANGYFARQDTKTPVRFGIIAMVSNMLLNVLFIALLWGLESEALHSGLALATAVSAFVNAYLLGRGLRQAGILHWHPGWGMLLMQVTVASGLMGGVLLWLQPDLPLWSAMDLWHRVAWLASLVVLGKALYFASLWVSGLRPRHLRHP